MQTNNFFKTASITAGSVIIGSIAGILAGTLICWILLRIQEPLRLPHVGTWIFLIPIPGYIIISRQMARKRRYFAYSFGIASVLVTIVLTIIMSIVARFQLYT